MHSRRSLELLFIRTSSKPSPDSFAKFPQARPSYGLSRRSTRRTSTSHGLQTIDNCHEPPLHILNELFRAEQVRHSAATPERPPWPLIKKLTVESNRIKHDFDTVALRDCCPCSRCIDSSTTQKLFETTDIPLSIEATNVQVNDDGSFCVSWVNDINGFEEHRSCYPASFLAPRPTPTAVKAAFHRNYPRILWNRSDLEAMKDEMTIEYDDYMSDNQSLLQLVQYLTQYGLAFISNVPNVSESVASIGNRIGPFQNTIYGNTWDVRSLPSAKNVADTSADLGFHMVSHIAYFLAKDGSKICYHGDKSHAVSVRNPPLQLQGFEASS